MSKYAKMTQAAFDAILEDLADEFGYFHVPGVYEALAEYYNNAVLEEWEDRQSETRNASTHQDRKRI